MPPTSPVRPGDSGAMRKREDIAERLLTVITRTSQSLGHREIIRLFEQLDGMFRAKIDLFLEMERRTNDLVRKIDIAESYMELRDIHADLNELQRTFFDAFPSVPDLQATCTAYRDCLSSKIIAMVNKELITQSIYMPDESFAYLALGSDGRSEQTLFTDQDNLIAYEDSRGRYKEVFYEKFSTLLVERLAFCGFKKCTGEIMPSNPLWRGGFSRWMERIDNLCRFSAPDFRKNLVNLIVLTDLRFVHGDAAFAETFIAAVFRRIFDNHIVVNEIAKSAAMLSVAKGFMDGLKTEKKGKFKGMVNIKLKAWAPLVLTMRAFALKNRIMAVSTVDRIDALVERGAFREEDGTLFRRAYFFLTRLRIFCQIMYLDGRYPSDIFILPEDLSEADMKELLETLGYIEELQKLLVESMGLRL